MRNVYLDQAATSQPKQEVIETMMPYLRGDMWYNPSSLYGAGVRVKKDVEKARKTVADYIGADSSEIYFTSSGSESNCWVIQGWVNQCLSEGKKARIFTSTIEHKSILKCLADLEDIHYGKVLHSNIGVDEQGFLFLDDGLEFLLNYHIEHPECYKNEKTLASIVMANNEIGTIQSIREISDMVHRYGALLHVDAVQAMGQIPIDVKKLGIDMMTVSGHKIGCPRGCAFLYKKNDVDIKPVIYGSQMDGLRGGTEATANIIGMAKAVELLRDNELNKMSVENHRNYLIKLLEDIGCKLIGSREHRLPNNINIMLPSGVGAEETMLMLDTAGVMCSTGSACNSRMVEPSHVLKAIGLTDEESSRCIRLTLPDDITVGDIDYTVEEIKKCIKLLGVNM